MTTNSWNAVDLTNSHERQDAIHFARKVMETAGNYRLHHDLDWALCDKSDHRSLAAFKLDRGDGIYGFGLLSCQAHPLRFQLGKLTYYQRMLTRHNLWSGPLIVGVSKESSAWQDLARAFLQAAKSHLSPSFGAIGIEGVPIEDPFYQLLRRDPDINKDYLLIEQGHSLIHQFIDLPASLEAYVEQLDASSKRNLAHSKRRLLRDFADDIEIVCYERQDDVRSFLDHADRLSEKTHHWRQFGLCSRDRETFKRRLEFAAQQAWLRSYIMFCSGRPVAFLLGYQYQDCFYQADVKVDPDYSRWSVLSMLEFEVLEDLYARERRPSTLDCSISQSDRKTCFANREQLEANLLLMPRTLRHAMLAGAYRRLDGLARFTLTTADRIGVKQALEKTTRTFATPKTSG